MNDFVELQESSSSNTQDSVFNAADLWLESEHLARIKSVVNKNTQTGTESDRLEHLRGGIKVDPDGSFDVPPMLPPNPIDSAAKDGFKGSIKIDPDGNYVSEVKAPIKVSYPEKTTRK